MKKKLSLLLLCALLSFPGTWMACATAADGFADIKGHWGERVINEVAGAGLMQGMGRNEQGDRIFAPDSLVSRAQAASALAAAFHLNFGEARFVRQPLASDYFDDVNADDWYGGALVLCAFNQVFPAGDRLFKPGQSISRIDMAKAIRKCFIAKNINVPVILMAPIYQDMGDLSQEEQQAVAFTYNAGIMRGADGVFRPHDPLTRAELAQILGSCNKAANWQADIDENSNDREYSASLGQTFVLALPANPSTGFQWDFDNSFDSGVISLLDSWYQASSQVDGIVGGGGVHIWRFKAVGPGSTEIELRYARPWESVQPLKTFKIKVIVPADESRKGSDLFINTRDLKDNGKYMIVDMKVPVITGVRDPAVQAAINQRWLKDAMDFRDSVASGLADYLKDAQEMAMPNNPFGSYSSYETCTLKPGFISMYVDYYQYTGGAHGLTDRMAYNIDLSNGNKVMLGDLFTSGYAYESKINQAIAAAIKSSPEMYFDGAFSGIKENQEYYIKDNHLIIYFQQYEIAPYAAGIPEFSIPLSELSAGLKPDLQKSLSNA